MLATCLALTWLNPHVYLDTVVLLGSVAAEHRGGSAGGSRAGAATASVAVVRRCSGTAPPARAALRPAAWPGGVLDGVIAAVMVAIGVGLILADPIGTGRRSRRTARDIVAFAVHSGPVGRVTASWSRPTEEPRGMGHPDDVSVTEL